MPRRTKSRRALDGEEAARPQGEAAVRIDLLTRRASEYSQSILDDLEVLHAADSSASETEAWSFADWPQSTVPFGARSTEQGVQFTQPRNDERVLCIAGDFNNWQPETHRMYYDVSLHAWTLLIPLPPGRYRYRLVADGRWRHDAFNRYVEANPYGQLNNVVEHLPT